MKVRYSSNNSGGVWWLEDQDWRNLEAAGWTVEWVKDWGESVASGEDRWLGALATSATKDGFDDMWSAKDAWESVTRKYPDAVGCECCGKPHDFYETTDDA